MNTFEIICLESQQKKEGKDISSQIGVRSAECGVLSAEC